MYGTYVATYLQLEGNATRIRPSHVTRTLLMADRVGNQLLLVLHGASQTAFPATDSNIAVVLRAGLRIHEHVLTDGLIDYREIGESRDYFETVWKISGDFEGGAPWSTH